METLRWSLTQDIADPTRFVEEFTVESWAEHLRQHERMAVSDTELHAASGAPFTAGPPLPRVQHFFARDVRRPRFAEGNLPSTT